MNSKVSRRVLDFHSELLVIVLHFGSHKQALSANYVGKTHKSHKITTFSFCAVAAWPHKGKL